MRITQNMLNNTMLRNLNNSLIRMDRLQDMMSTGKKISRPSHDPIIAMFGIQYRTNLTVNKQYYNNANDAIDWLKESEAAVNEGKDILVRVKDLMTQAATDTLNPADREKIREELIQLREQMGNVANATLNGNYIFGGTNTDIPPFKDGAYQNKNRTDINLEVSPSVQLPINVDGIQLFGQQKGNMTKEELENSGYETDLFELMNKLIEELKPSEYITDQYGRRLAADKDGNPIVDADNKVALYDPANPDHRPLEKIADGKALGYDPKNPLQIEIFDKSDISKDGYVRLPAQEDKKPADGKQLTGYLDTIQNHIDNFLQVQSEIGARMNRLEIIQNRLETQSQSIEDMMSMNEDADPARVIIDLQNNEYVYRSALAAGARIIQPSLLDFLR
ncbi:flagellar hook-associated protein FlgL [Aneurinibacillus aneurinilyticus]|uniref:flagellar hook-associated protein FlgL n=1 Tax=Aneurinibacillus aneurinilyticus TaxID=1391 RepID=UPI0023F7B1BF|nr:flagellar hook-associated protein FlgL [Aneurinibacillus aneurinilyticus]MCI1693970.1 flagellar hook-associated protein FlgL [Aneurinibacillus aneurinilyticus]